jgi:hypothetical protein
LDLDVMLLQETPAPPPGSVALWRPVPGQGWGSAVVVTRGALDAVSIPGFEGWAVGGEWQTAAGQAPESRRFLFSVHSPTKKSGKGGGYVAESRAIVRAIVAAVPPDCQLVIGGDFNFKSLGERQRDETVQTPTVERAALKEFADVGLVPAWQAVHPGKPLPQTLRWTGNRSAPYHCDGFLMWPAVAARAVCEVLTAHWLEASDHYPVAAWVV